MPVHLSDDPLTAVVRGTGIALEHFNLLQKIMINSRSLGELMAEAESLRG